MRLADGSRPYGGHVRVAGGFVEAMVASPLGVTLLAVLESRAQQPEGSLSSLETTPASVAAAVEAVESMSFGDFVDVAVLTGAFHVGPWISDAPATVAASYHSAPARRPIAEAVSRCFGTQLHRDIDRDAQQWWTDWPAADPHPDSVGPLFGDFDGVYGAGQFTSAGLWTVTDPPAEAHEQLIAAWELERGPVSRWLLPVDETARIFEIHRPADWARLVTEHPREASPEPVGACWELPTADHSPPPPVVAPRRGWVASRFGWLGPRRSEFTFGIPEGFVAPPPTDVSALMAIPGQRAARTTIGRHLVPDWRSVAERYDGVHLSWAGFITGEGCITDLGTGDVTMLRYWFSERTHWLTDVFGEPQHATDPARVDAGSGVPSSPSDLQQRRHEQSLRRLLGR